MPKPGLCVIFNPTAGKHRGLSRLQEIRKSWETQVEFRPTQHAGHAVELAEQAANEGFSIVAAAGGDGTAHEVLNGLMRAGNCAVQFSILPIGSANDYAFSLGLDHPNGPAPPRRVDVGVIRAAGGKTVYFGCCLGLGFNGHISLESRQFAGSRAFFFTAWRPSAPLIYHYRSPVMTIHIDSKPVWRVPTLLFSALIGKREGGFVMAPRAEVDDGWLDFIHVGNLTRWEILRFLPRLALFGPPESYAKIRQGRCRHVHLRSESPLIIHADGEFFCLPADRIQEVEIDIMAGALPVTALE